MSVGALAGQTANMYLNLPNFDVTTWHQYVNDNFTVIDALLGLLAPPNAGMGVWMNGVQYSPQFVAIDGSDGTLWRCNVLHTSALTGTFAEERAANPLYWAYASVATPVFVNFTNTNTAYDVGWWVLSENSEKYGVVQQPFTATAGETYDQYETSGEIQTLIDFTAWITDYDIVQDPNYGTIITLTPTTAQIQASGDVTVESTSGDAGLVAPGGKVLISANDGVTLRSITNGIDIQSQGTSTVIDGIDIQALEARVTALENA